VMGAPAEKIVFCDALGRSWGESTLLVSRLSWVVVVGWPSSFLIIFPFVFILEDILAFKKRPSWMCASSMMSRVQSCSCPHGLGFEPGRNQAVKGRRWA
jgi:hypothetical protein